MYKYILLSKDYPNTYIISIYFIVYAPMAQLGRASDTKANLVNRRFESSNLSWGSKQKSLLICACKIKK